VDTTISYIVHELGSFVSFEQSVGMILVLVSIHASCMSRPEVPSVAVTAQTRFLRIFTSVVVITPRFVRGLSCLGRSGLVSGRRALTKVCPTVLLGTLVVFT
jgi:hypothetical protein